MRLFTFARREDKIIRFHVNLDRSDQRPAAPPRVTGNAEIRGLKTLQQQSRSAGVRQYPANQHHKRTGRLLHGRARHPLGCLYFWDLLSWKIPSHKDACVLPSLHVGWFISLRCPLNQSKARWGVERVRQLEVKVAVRFKVKRGVSM